MRPDIAISGGLGLTIGTIVFLLTSWYSAYLPLLVQGSVPVMVVFVLLLLIALAEMPMMLFALRRMSTSAGVPRGLIVGTNIAYIAFASIYASIFVLVTGEFTWSLVLALLSLVRFGSGILIK